MKKKKKKKADFKVLIQYLQWISNKIEANKFYSLHTTFSVIFFFFSG